MRVTIEAGQHVSFISIPQQTSDITYTRQEPNQQFFVGAVSQQVSHIWQFFFGRMRRETGFSKTTARRDIMEESVRTLVRAAVDD